MLNIIAAAFQMSSFTHVELSIGEVPGARGEMKNVCRVFNDSVGVVRARDSNQETTALVRLPDTPPSRSGGRNCVPGRDATQVRALSRALSPVLSITHASPPHVHSLSLSLSLGSLHVPAARVLEGGRECDARVREVGSGKALFQCRNGEVYPLSQNHDGRILFLRRCRAQNHCFRIRDSRAAPNLALFFCAELVAAVLKKGGLM